jgi:glycosyltransferase involved in cell wall biosynthesis
MTGTIRLTVTPAEHLAECGADVVLVQRIAIQEMGTADRIIDACRRRGSRLLYEIDDDLFHLSEDHPEWQFYAARVEAASRLAKAADAVVVSTEALGQRLQSFNPRTVVLPNYLDERLWSEAPKTASFSPGEVRIVYVGTMSHRADLEMLGCAVRNLRPRYRDRISLDVVGVADHAGESDWFRTVCVPSPVALSYPRFVEWIQARSRWHWGLAPLVDTPFNRCKSPLKHWEYAALGIPSICSEMPVYSETVRNGQTGLLVGNDSDSWTEVLERAADDKTLWDRIREATPTVASAATMAANAETVRNAWLSLIQGDRMDAIAWGASH